MCVSCTARIAILYLFSVLFTLDHFSMPVILLEGAAKPFMLMVAMLMFAFILGFVRWLLVILWPLGGGECWWALVVSSLMGGAGGVPWAW
jgi:hypothetical protein